MRKDRVPLERAHKNTGKNQSSAHTTAQRLHREACAKLEILCAGETQTVQQLIPSTSLCGHRTHAHTQFAHLCRYATGGFQTPQLEGYICVELRLRRELNTTLDAVCALCNGSACTRIHTRGLNPLTRITLVEPLSSTLWLFSSLLAIANNYCHYITERKFFVVMSQLARERETLTNGNYVQFILYNSTV